MEKSNYDSLLQSFNGTLSNNYKIDSVMYNTYKKYYSLNGIKMF